MIVTRTFEITQVNCSILDLRWVFRGSICTPSGQSFVVYAPTTPCGKKHLHERKQEDPYQMSDLVRGGELWGQSTEDDLWFSFLWWSPRRAPLDRQRCFGVLCRRAMITSTEPRPRCTNGLWMLSLSFKKKRAGQSFEGSVKKRWCRMAKAKWSGAATVCGRTDELLWTSLCVRSHFVLRRGEVFSLDERSFV